MPVSVDSKPLTSNAKPFRCNTYEKHRGVVLLWLTSHPTKGVCPERPSGVKELMELWSAAARRRFSCRSVQQPTSSLEAGIPLVRRDHLLPGRGAVLPGEEGLLLKIPSASDE